MAFAPGTEKPIPVEGTVLGCEIDQYRDGNWQCDDAHDLIDMSVITSKPFPHVVPRSIPSDPPFALLLRYAVRPDHCPDDDAMPVAFAQR